MREVAFHAPEASEGIPVLNTEQVINISNDFSINQKRVKFLSSMQFENIKMWIIAYPENFTTNSY